MNKSGLTSLFKKALKYVEDNHPDEIQRAKNTNIKTFRNITSRGFLEQYCWVIYTSGFKVSIVDDKFDSLRYAFKKFNLHSLSKMRSVKKALKIINNDRKAYGFLKGTRLINEEGFPNFKKRIETGGMDILEELPFIGPITKKHLAKNIGLMDIAKDDIWLERIRAKYSARTVNSLIKFLSKIFNQSQHVIDVVLWRYCSDHRRIY